MTPARMALMALAAEVEGFCVAQSFRCQLWRNAAQPTDEFRDFGDLVHLLGERLLLVGMQAAELQVGLSAGLDRGEGKGTETSPN